MRNPIHRISPELWFALRPTVCRVLGKLSIFHQSYTPFVVFSTPRSGSTLLIKSLQRHPQIVTRDEVLNPADPACVEGSPIESLRRVYLPQPPSVEAVGCKIHYMQSPFGKDVSFEGSDTDMACEWLRRSKPDLKVIHLIRENRLRVQVSLLLAHASNRWFLPRSSSLDDRNGKPKRVALDVDAWADYMARTAKRRKEVFSNFDQESVFRVTYTELVQDWDGATGRLQSFLGVEPCAIPQETRKQNPEPLAELIENYAEVESVLRGTDQEWMLDDEY